MPDNPFAVFALDPAPALDADALKDQFAKLTAAQHPDKFSSAGEAERAEADTRYAATNRAYQTLIDPRARLLALYELTKGEKPRDVQRIPPGTMDLSSKSAKPADRSMNSSSANAPPAAASKKPPSPARSSRCKTTS